MSFTFPTPFSEEFEAGNQEQEKSCQLRGTVLDGLVRPCLTLYRVASMY